MLRPPQFFQLMEAGSTLSDVGEDVGELGVRRPSGELQQDFAPWTFGALRIRKVVMHDPVKCIEQFSFQIHICHFHRTLSPAPMPCFPQQNHTIDGRCR
jgi:hypothetical protein